MNYDHDLKMSTTRAMAQLFPQAALWLTMGILAFGWIQAVLSFGNEIQLLATCLEIQVAEGHWTEMKKLPTVSEIHVKFGVRRSSSSILSFYVLYIIYNYLYIPKNSNYQKKIVVCVGSSF